MQVMTLSKQEKQTCDNVRKFFKTDFERYSQLAELVDLKSIRYDGMPSANNVNHQENKMITTFYYKNIVETVKGIISRMHNECYRDLIKYRHLEHLSYSQIAQRMSYGESTVKVKINQAYLLFAEMLALVTDIDLRGGKENENKEND